jgi:hypothetical protein
MSKCPVCGSILRSPINEVNRVNAILENLIENLEKIDKEYYILFEPNLSILRKMIDNEGK